MRFLLLTTLFFSLSVLAKAQEKFPFALPFDDDSKTVIDNSSLNPAPLVDAHRLRVNNGHFTDQNGRRVRLLGVNFGTSANFPTRADAAKVAARLHKFGFNVVRLHHMDASWSNPSIFGANHDGWSGPTDKVSPESLQKLDGLLAELQKQGIYANLNLHVSRRLTPGDGFENTEKLPELGKVLSYFEPRFIALQKEFARQILTHKNTQTGSLYATDPTLAFVELTNEDTLVGQAWNGVLHNLPAPYRGQLQKAWNEFLAEQYPSTEKLKAAWGAGENPGANLLSNPRFEGAPGSWQLETLDTARASFAIEKVENAPFAGRALRVSIAQIPDTDWKIQFQQPRLNLSEGEFYTATFWARSEAPRPAVASFTLDQAPWSGVGGLTRLEFSPEWKKFRIIFRARGVVPGRVRLTISLGAHQSAVSFADFQLARGQFIEWNSDASLEKRSLDFPPTRAASEVQALDWLRFLSGIEQKYVAQMTDYLRKELGYRGLITCSQASYGGFAGVLRESATDFVDMHAYWQHPEFPNRSWDAKDWVIRNTPMSDDANGGTLLDLATHRIAGKPFTVSEYNHAAPHDFASETIPAILGYAGAQDWDGVYLFSYNGDAGNWNPGKIRGFFDADSDPNKMAFFPVMARAFLRGEIAPFVRQTRLQIRRDSLYSATFGKGEFEFWNNVSNHWRDAGLSRHDLTESQLALELTSTGAQSKLVRTGGANAATSGGFAWIWSREIGKITASGHTFFAASGRLGHRWETGQIGSADGNVRFESLQSSNDWATLALGSRDGLPLQTSRSLLLTVLNRAENQGMSWNAARTSVGDGWGNGPPLVEIPSGTLHLQTNAKSAQIFSLSPTGERVQKLPSRLENGVLSFDFAGTQKSVWFEIALS